VEDEDRSLQVHLAANVRLLQESAGLSVVELAEVSGVRRIELERFLRGDEDVRLDVIDRLAKALGVQPGQLFSGVEWVPDGRGGGDFHVHGTGG
jgi:transcriptional regulator with XRE-family HTH domain